MGVRKELTRRYDPFRNRAANWLRTIERISLKDTMENQSAIKLAAGSPMVRLSKIGNYLAENLLWLILSDLKRAFNRKGLAADWDPHLVAKRFEQNANWQSPSTRQGAPQSEKQGRNRRKASRSRCSSVCNRSSQVKALRFLPI